MAVKHALAPTVRWRSRSTFVLALAAAALGLSNLWRFATLAGEHGGGAFVLAYTLCLLALAVPVQIAEVALGSHSRASPITAIAAAADRAGRSPHWRWLGVLICLCGLLLAASLAVVAGWSLYYLRFMQNGTFAAASLDTVAQHFALFVHRPLAQLLGLTLFLLPVCLVLALGVRRGIGMLAWWLVPAVMVVLAVLIDFALQQGDLRATEIFLFSTRWSQFTLQSFWLALGQALFSLGVGVGAGIAYGAYAPESIPVGRSVAAVAVFDTLVGIAAGLALLPVIFANNLLPASGPALAFIALPYSYGNLVQGEVYGALFYLLFVLLALGSTVAMLEPILAHVMDRSGLRRGPAALVVVALLWVLAAAGAMTLAVWGGQPWLGGRGVLAWLESMTAALLLPVSCLLLALFVGFGMRREALRVELYRESPGFFALWLLLLRALVPLLLLLTIVAALRGTLP